MMRKMLGVKRIAAFLIALVMAVTVLPLQTAYASEAWYAEAVSGFESKGFYNGGYELAEYISGNDFIRLAVLSNSYRHAEDPITAALSNNWITQGMRSSLEGQITRRMALVLAYNICAGSTENMPSFDELKAFAIASGIMVGDGDGNLREGDFLTYAEAIQLLANVKNYRNAQNSLIIPRAITVEEFFADPAALGFYMSDDGEYLYFLAPSANGNGLDVFRQRITDTEPEQVTEITERLLAGYFLKGNYLVYMADDGGDENYHMYAVEIGAGFEETDLTPYPGVRVVPIDLLENSEDSILAYMNMNNPQVFDVYKINVVTGEATLIAENPGDVQGWLTDWQGNVRVAVVSDSIDTVIMYREDENSDFGVLAMAGNADTLSPLAFSKDGTLLYFLSNVGRNTTSIISIDLATGEEKLLYANENYDIYDLALSDDGSEITAVIYCSDKPEVLYFDPRLEAAHKQIAETFGTEHFAGQLSKDKTKALVTVSSDINPGEYYYYDMDTGVIVPLGAAMPWLSGNDLCEMIPVSYTARDGLVINGYLTIPKGVTPENLPVVVNPHGGPWARDYWGYNPEVQLLANQGYAVLQMNFRGSTGYGKEFMFAGDKQWGRAMQDDITDGVNWLINIGVADPDRIAIYGASYGGYATLAGITLTPDLYAAAVDYVGVSNLLTFMETIPAYWESMRQYLYDRIGHPVEDYDDLVAYSPVNLADRITTPLFVAQGANDPRVNKNESDQIVEALRARGVEVEYMVKEQEGHGFMRTENQYDFYNAMVRFLENYLK